eukprot:4454797-Amphidinium_carterae.1
MTMPARRARVTREARLSANPQPPAWSPKHPLPAETEMDLPETHQPHKGLGWSSELADVSHLGCTDRDTRNKLMHILHGNVRFLCFNMTSWRTRHPALLSSGADILM